MHEVFIDPEQLTLWQDVLRASERDWDAVFACYRACVDWPATVFWRELADYYPDARVLLNVRPTADWVRSMQATICKLLPNRTEHPDEYAREVLEMAEEVVNRRTFDGRLDDPSLLADVFEQRIAEVKEAIEPERLLIFDVREGWEPLCEFLGKPVPEEPFPRGNNAAEFWQIFGSEGPG